MYYALSRCVDDAGVDYTSLLDTEQRRARLTSAKNICNVLQKYLLRSGSARSCWTRRCGRAWRWARCTASCSDTSTAGTEPRWLPLHLSTPTNTYSWQCNGELCLDPSRLPMLNALFSSFGCHVCLFPWNIIWWLFLLYRECQVSWQWKVCHMETKQKLQSFRKCTKRN